MTIKPPQHVQYRTYNSPVFAVCSSVGWASSIAHTPRTVFRPLNRCKGPETNDCIACLPATTVDAFERGVKLAWSLRREPISLQASVRCCNVRPLIAGSVIGMIQEGNFDISGMIANCQGFFAVNLPVNCVFWCCCW